ncbi:MAG: hypothetical protein ACKV19_25575 [Verrucomicrobiales bacterium]
MPYLACVTLSASTSPPHEVWDFSPPGTRECGHLIRDPGAVAREV